MVTWPAGGAIQAFIPALGQSLPAADSVEAALAGARTFIEQAIDAGMQVVDLPTDVDVQAHVVEVELSQSPAVPPELLAAVLTTAVGDVISVMGNNRELLAALLSTLTGMAVQLHDDIGSAFDDLDFFEPPAWSEERFQQAVRELLNARLRTTQTTAGERARARKLLQQAIAEQLALARELNLDSL